MSNLSKQDQHDNAKFIRLDKFGNIYVAGAINNGDYGLIKYNSSGIRQWIRTYNGPANGDDSPSALFIDTSGYIYVTGGSTGSNSGSDYCTIKYNTDGNELWVARYNGPHNSTDIANSIGVDNSGNVYVTGASMQFNNVSTDYCTIKYNSLGVQQWISNYNGPSNRADNAKSIILDLQGNLYITGGSEGIASMLDFCTVKYNNQGIQQWVVRFDRTTFTDFALNVSLDQLGNVIVSGVSSLNSANIDYCVIKYNSNGIQQWNAFYNSPNNSSDMAHDHVIDLDNNIIISGTSLSSLSHDFCTVKYNSAGSQLWVRTFDGSSNGDDQVWAVATDNIGNIFVTGSGDSLLNMITIKYSANGSQEWVASYNGNDNNTDIANDIAIDNSQNVYITGISYGDTSNADFCTIKYSQSIGIHIISNDIPKVFSLSQNFPNPFNPETKLQFALPNSSPARLVIYDAQGREVATLVNEHLEAGTYQASWSAEMFSSGIYYYQLTTDNYTDTKKMIFIK